jgi:predicted DNA-binding transcriptional regulator AlpA
MTEWSFRLTIAGLDLTDEELDALFAAGCDDATFSLERDGAVVGVFDRQREVPEDAVFSAIDQVESVGEVVRVLRVTQEDDWLNASEIAQRVGRSRQNINQLISQKRGPGGFPFPVARHGASNPLYSWAEVEAWFERYEPSTVPSHGPKLSPDFLAELNDTLDLRERHRRHAPWRSQLAERLPLGAA